MTKEDPQEAVVDAQRSLDEASSEHRWDSAEVRSAKARLAEAQRSAAAAVGAPFAVPLDLGVRWDAGAPLPLLISGHKTFVAFYLPEDFAFDGTNPRSRRPSDDGKIGVVEFLFASAAKMGIPNDELIHGHPLWGHGLEVYGAHLVENSPWIRELMEMSRAHPRFDEARWRDRRHYLFAFYDDTLDCIASGHRVRVETGTLREVSQQLAAEAAG